MFPGEHAKNDFVVLDGMVNPQYQDETRLLLQKRSKEEKQVNSEALLGHFLMASFVGVKVDGSLYRQDRSAWEPSALPIKLNYVSNKLFPILLVSVGCH